MNNRTEAGIFRLTKSGSFSWVVPSFATGGVNYGIELIQASNGNFYGRMVKKSKRWWCEVSLTLGMKDNKWLRLLTYVTGLVNQELLLQNELTVVKTPLSY
jgi:hypothetical protein